MVLNPRIIYGANTIIDKLLISITMSVFKLITYLAVLQYDHQYIIACNFEASENCDIRKDSNLYFLYNPFYHL